jgi:5-oxoprolinase (ATP-hydrolysing)
MAGVLSALGIGLADTTAMREQSVETQLEASALERLAHVADSREQTARAELRDEGIPPELIRAVRRVHLRYEGTDTALPVELAGLEPMTAAFEASHRATCSFLMDRPLIAGALSVEATGPPSNPTCPKWGIWSPTAPTRRKLSGSTRVDRGVTRRCVTGSGCGRGTA